MRERLLPALDPLHLTEIHGSTDSEHVFRYLMTLWENEPDRPLLETLRLGIEQVAAWCGEVGAERPLSLNQLWTNGEEMVGSRLNRTLWYLERDSIVRCKICGKSHVYHDPQRAYRSLEIASEAITHEDWLHIPNGTMFAVDPDFRLHIAPMGPLASAMAQGVELA